MKKKIALSVIFFVLGVMLLLLTTNTIVSKSEKAIMEGTASNPSPIFYLNFEGETILQRLTDKVGGDTPSQYSGIIETSFVVDGIEGLALSNPAAINNYVLSYSELRNIASSKGTVKFWIRLLNQPPNVNNTYFWENAGNGIRIRQENGSEVVNFNCLGKTDSARNRGWSEGEWHQIAFTWEDLGPVPQPPQIQESDFKLSLIPLYKWRTKIYIDGYFKPYQPVNCNFYNEFEAIKAGLFDKFYVGCKAKNSELANADIDELKIYDTALSEEQIRSDYNDLFPVEYYAKETVFETNKSTKSTIDVNNLQSTPITGKVKCSIPNIGSWYSNTVKIPANGKSSITTGNFSLPNEQEYNLECYFIPDGEPETTRYKRTIKLFAIAPNARLSRDNLYLNPILSIDCEKNQQWTYSNPGQYASTYVAGVGNVMVRQTQSSVNGPTYCDTGDATIGEIPNVGKYMQSGPSGKAKAYTPYYDPSLDDGGFGKSSVNAYHDDNYYATATPTSGILWNTYYNFNIPYGTIPENGIKVYVRLDAKKEGNNEGYIYVQISWDGGQTWCPSDPPPPYIHVKAEDNEPNTYVRWPHFESTTQQHNWLPSELANDKLRVRIGVSDSEFLIDWCAVRVFYDGYFSRFAYKFQLQNPSNPHLIVVTYPDDKVRIMGIDLSSKISAVEGYFGYEIETGVFTGDASPIENDKEYENTGEFKQHSIFFWPIYNEYGNEYMITFVNWLANAGAAAKQIDVYEIEGNEQTGWFPKTEVITPSDGGRSLGLWWEDACFIDCFGSKDLNYYEFYKAVQNAMDYLHYTGQNLITYCIWQYVQPFYPSRTEHNIFTTALRTVIHPYPADWFELLLRVAEKNNINVIASLTIRKIPSLEMLRETDTGYTVDNIRTRLLDTVNDILEQYGDYPAFKGISLNIWNDTINRCFGNQNENINNLLADISDRIKQEGRSDLKLIVSCWYPSITVQDSHLSEQEWDLDDWINAQGDAAKIQVIRDMHKKLGLDLTQLQTSQDNGIRIERVIRFTSYREQLMGLNPPENVELIMPSRQFFLDGKTYEGCYEPFFKQDNIAAAIYNGYFESHIKKEGKPLLDGTSPCPCANLEKDWHAGAITPGHKYFMENYMLLMTHLDPVQIGNGGLTVGTVGHEEQIQQFAKAYRALPAKSFEIHTNNNDFQCRKLQTDQGFYFWVMNKKSDTITARLTFSNNYNLMDLSTEEELTIVARQPIYISLKPFQLRSFGPSWKIASLKTLRD